jgi:hypothetical protein
MKVANALVYLVLVAGLLGCDGREGPSPTGPSPAFGSAAPTSPPSTLRVFIEGASGFSTSDVRDAQEQIVQFSTAGELIWTADGTSFSGYPGSDVFINAEAVCNCWFEVRFGTRDGERRAYLTADYGHENPGTLVDLEVVSGALVASRTSVGPPGSFTLSGVVTVASPGGVTPLEGVRVARDYTSGWQGTTTDKNGFYEIPGVYAGTHTVVALQEGFRTESRTLSITGDERVDFALVRR